VSGKGKSPVGRASSRAGAGQKKQAARQEPRPTSLHEDAPPYRVTADDSPSPGGEGWGEGGRLRFIDLFCGIGGFRLAFERAGGKCVFSSDWNEQARITQESD
jgi:hypothetical protein